MAIWSMYYVMKSYVIIRLLIDVEITETSRDYAIGPMELIAMDSIGRSDSNQTGGVDLPREIFTYTKFEII